MSYKNFGCVKTIVLPLDYDFISEHSSVPLEQFSKAYEKEYGINFYNLIRLRLDEGSGYIMLDAKALVILSPINDYLSLPKGSYFPYMKSTIDANWESGGQTGQLCIMIADKTESNSGFGMMLALPQESEFKKENIIVSIYEL